MNPIQYIKTGILVRAGLTFVRDTLEAVLASRYPEAHENYMQTMTDAFDRRTNAFLQRNQELVERFGASQEENEAVIYDFLAKFAPKVDDKSEEKPQA